MLHESLKVTKLVSHTSEAKARFRWVNGKAITAYQLQQAQRTARSSIPSFSVSDTRGMTWQI